jgi:hypothetical protein
MGNLGGFDFPRRFAPQGCANLADLCVFYAVFVSFSLLFAKMRCFWRKARACGGKTLFLA